MTEALVRDVMTPCIRQLDASESIRAAAEAMRADDVGDVILIQDGKVRGIVTDRDIAVRGVAEGLDPSTTPAWEIASFDLTAIPGDAPVAAAVRVMRERSLRRLLVVNQDKQLSGIVTLGDLAAQPVPQPARADTSHARPNR